MEENDFLKEELLRRAVKQMCEDAYEKEEEMPLHEFSETFEREMETLLESRKRPVYRKRKKYRVLLLAGALIVLSAGTVLAMYPLMRAKMGGIQADVKIDHVEFGLADRKPVTAEEVEKIPFEVKKLDQVPEGFELYQEVLDEEGKGYMAFYRDETDRTLDYSQSCIHTAGIDITGNGTPMKKYSILGKDVYFFTDGIRQSATLEWENYLYAVVGDLSEEEMLELMENLIEKL